MDKVLELSIRAVIRHLNGDMTEFNKYKNKAIKIYEHEKFKESCRYQIRHMVPEETRQKLYEMVS
ncbi:hypothetical protein KQI38_07590 [Tissierella carlieri]|uniref:hypothetical protein n=1 Tax=Tissierella carlieri TaxID=689904 RepID=UPI001C105DC4|nr:hypothetical protein [Tissierella carlieri]MBU5311889.1 hypothetical protein [Tissierella carlieri]